MRTVRRDGARIGLTAAVVITCILMLGPGFASAYDVQIHGYGNQDFIMTNKTNYLEAEEGTWDINSMSLLFTANVTDDTSVWAKIYAESEKTTMEWLYVNKKLGAGTDARVGQMKLPMGIFNLIRDNRFLQLGETSPSMYLESVDMVHENFRGAGVEYNNDWLTLEAIAGGPEIEEDEASSSFSVWSAANELTTTTIEKEVRELVGGRIKIKTPLDGLSFMVSASMFDEEQETTIEVMNTATATSTVTSNVQEFDERLWIASMEYVKHDLQLRAEYGRKSGGDEAIVSYYGEVGYTFFDRLTPYVRYDYITTDIGEKSEAASHQTDTTIGIGYSINEYFKVKIENHFINGWALAAERGDVDPTDPSLPERWNMLVAGVNFMF